MVSPDLNSHYITHAHAHTYTHTYALMNALQLSLVRLPNVTYSYTWNGQIQPQDGNVSETDEISGDSAHELYIASENIFCQ